MNILSNKNKNSRHLPNFLIVGAAKCGTTSLYYYLLQHPDVYMSPVKEPKFLSGFASKKFIGPGDGLLASQAVKTFDAYYRLFEKSVGKKAVGEASVETIFLYQETIPAIQHHLGDPRIIIILRNPVERAYSAYNFLVRDGWEELSFKDALKQEEKRKREGYCWHWRYREVGLYANQVRAFREHFSRVHVFLYDDLEINANKLIRSVYTFLDVNPYFIPDIIYNYNVSGIPRSPFLNALFVKPKRLHKAARIIGGAILGADRWVRLRDNLRSANLREPPPIDPEIKQQLNRYYRKDILKLQDCIHRDLSKWLENK
ncbi:MAG: sulfotransferase [Smithellaceae bacterium]|jgi:hypothetical protein